MRSLRCDVAIIGAGSAGLAARDAAVAAGASTLLIESGPGGTTCARSGCMPSKLLIAAAGAAHAVRHAGLFGIVTDGPTIDGPAVMTRVRRERDGFVEGVLDTERRIPAEERLQGRARFVGAGRLAIGDAVEVEARAVVVATGSRSTIPEPLRGFGDLVLTNETVFELPDLPRSLAVIGAGPLGLELAQSFARLGTAVTVLDQGTRIGGVSDPEVARAARRILAGDLHIRLGAAITARRVQGGVELSWTESEGGGGCRVFERVLAAAGRPPNVEGLGLEQTGIALDHHGLPVFDPRTMRCGASAIYMAGDADDDRPVLHEASDEGRIAGRNAARHPESEPADRKTPLAIVYTDPEIAIVGGGWPAVEADDPVTGAVDLSGSGRARVLGRNAGVIRVYGRSRDGVLLGGEMIGPDIEHLAHGLAWLVQLGLTADEALALPFYHPTVEESLRTALEGLRDRIHAPPR